MAKKLTAAQTIKFYESRLQEAMEKFAEVAPEAVRKQGYEELVFIANAYDAEMVFSARGLPTPLLPYQTGPNTWGRVKERKSFDPRRGHAAHRGLAYAVKNRSILRETASGYRLDITRVGKNIRNYWRDYNREKAGGNLLNFKAGFEMRHFQRVRDEAYMLVQQILGDAMKAGGNRRVIEILTELQSQVKAGVGSFNKGNRLLKR